MRLARYQGTNGLVHVVAIDNREVVYQLPYSDVTQMIREAREVGVTVTDLVLKAVESANEIQSTLDELQLQVPIEAPEVWAAGVTYERSREARNYETSQGKDGGLTFYDKVYDAKRPEIFFKSTAARTVGPGGQVCLRNDSQWQIPEPELGLVIAKDGTIIGYTVGNDMSCRDIEGENPLYLPQAKVWKQSCAIGPTIRLAETVDNPYNLRIECRIYRDGVQVFEGFANTGQLKRRFLELVSYLVRDNEIFDGTVLLTGTCVVPPNDFTLAQGDRIEIAIESIGTLVNEAILA